MENTTSKGLRYLGGFLKVAAGAGAVLGTSYIASRILEKQDTESSLSRLEQMVEDMMKSEVKGKPSRSRKQAE